jgi:hypothetical protein
MRAPVAVPHRAHHSGARSAWLRHFVFEYLLVLPMGALLALAWVIADPMSYYGFTMRAAFAVNDVAMVFFFGLMTKEIVEATAASIVAQRASPGSRHLWLVCPLDGCIQQNRRLE